MNPGSVLEQYLQCEANRVDSHEDRIKALEEWRLLNCKEKGQTDKEYWTFFCQHKVDVAVKAERERCAKIAASQAFDWEMESPKHACQNIQDAIQAGDDKVKK